jgi:hypothetical protein
MTTPSERENDQWSRQYLCCVLRHDTEGVIDLLAGVDPRSVWDRLDALGASARDLTLALTNADIATAILSRQLVADALASASRGGDAG